jgi:hypothetical protein
MSLAVIEALLGLLGTIIQDTPAAVALYNQVVTMIKNNTDPTAAEWVALLSQISTTHAAVQAA